MEIDDKWRTVSCPRCGGHGVRMRGDSLPFECGNCGGSGIYYIRPSGHLFQYPGGPAAGMWSERKYEEDGRPVQGVSDGS